MPGKKHRSLTEYEAAHPGLQGPGCWLCTIPEVAEVNAHLRGDGRPDGKPIPRSRILKWLREECGYETVTEHKVSNHYTQGHHTRFPDGQT